jgi:DNA-binding NarL/FixJ family response regulator
VDGALALRLLGRNADAEARLRPLWDRVRRRILPQATLEVGALFGAVLCSLGRLVEAEAVADECAQLGVRLVEFGPSRAFAIALPFQIAVSRGDWRRAVDGLRTTAATEPDPHYRLQTHMERAMALALVDPLGAVDEIGEAVSASLADAKASRCERCVAEATARGAEALARRGDVAGARALLDSREPHSSDAYGALCFRRARALLTVAEGLDSDAVGALEAVIADAEHQGLHLDALRARLDLGVLLAQSDRGRAVEVMRAAGADAERLGARTEQHLAERSLRSLGVRTWRRGAIGGGESRVSALSDRECEIAVMVSGGSTNPEIAAAMFVSRKTVERHVSNILAKLGMRNRAELAALSVELRAHRSAS